MDNKRTIMIMTDWFLPGFKAGGPIKSIDNIIRQLHDQFNFLIITSDRDLNDETPYQGVQTDEWVEKEKSSIIYLSPENLTRARFKELLEEKKPDVLYLNSLFSVKFTFLPLLTNKKLKVPSKVILAPRGMLGEKALSIKPFKKKLFLLTARFIGLFSEITWHASTPQEKNEIENAFGKKTNVKVAMNLASPVGEISRSHHKKMTDYAKLTFLSRISPKKNLLYLLERMAEIERKDSTELTVYGPIEDEEHYNKCKLFATEAGLKVEFPGPINPVQIPNELSKHDFYILPTLHENYGHTIVEAFSSGLPVLLSTHTPWRDLEEKNIGWDLDLEQPESWKEALEKCIRMDDETYQKMSVSALEFAKKITSDKDHLKQNIELFQTDLTGF